jgi:glycosyltransferase involved in cell wall biosynthesis
VTIIHTFFDKSEVIGWLVSLLTDVPTWITSRRDLGFKRNNIYKIALKVAARNCKKCVAVCHAVRDQMLEQKELPPNKIQVIYNGVESSRFIEQVNAKPLRHQLGVTDQVPLVGMIANLNFEIKGHYYFLEAARIVLNRVPDAHFVLAGDGPLRGKYDKMARDLGLADKVHFLGFRKDVPALLAELTISVLSSTSEGFSNVLLESMAAGNPIVATRVGGNSEIVADGITGLLIPPADPNALAEAIIKLLKTPQLASHMGSVGKIRVKEQFSVERMLESYEQLYTSLAARRQ